MDAATASNPDITKDNHQQLRKLYMSLITDHERFDEFKQMLSRYPRFDPSELEEEPDEAVVVRTRMNERLREWIGRPFEGLTPVQTMLWRTQLVDNRQFVAIAPWKESNGY